MANLFGQNIGTNYKGLLNLDSTTINTPLDTTLRAVTDGMGNTSPLQLSTNLLATTSAFQHDWNSTPIGAANKTTMWFDSIGRMAWRPGTGDNSYVRTFDTTGITANRVYTLPDATTTLAGLSVAQTFTQLQTFQRSIANSSGTNNNFGININYSINNTGGTNTINGLFVNGTETIMTGTTHHLVEIQRNSTSFFRVTNANGYPLLALNNTNLFALSGGSAIVCAPTNGYARIMSQDLGTNWIIFRNGFIVIGTNENILNPALKRNGAAIDFRLADDSGYCQYTGRVGNYTTTTKNALTPVAAGTFVYDTTLNKLSVYNGSAWETVTSA